MIQFGGADSVTTIRKRPHFFARVKTLWTDEWELAPWLIPLAAEDRLAPGMASARFRYDYGYIKRETTTSFAYEVAAKYRGKYVQIIAAWNNAAWVPFWHGILVDESYLPTAESAHPDGRQELAAVGLAHILDRIVIRGAHCEQSGATVAIDRCPTFNRRRRAGPTLIGNRSAGMNSDAVYEFSGAGDVWTNYEIAEYLLWYFSPFQADAYNVRFDLGGQATVLEGVEGVYDLEGMTVFQALNMLIPRKRGLAWSVRTSGAGMVAVYVSTHFSEDVSEFGVSIPANTEQGYITLDDDKEISGAVVQLSTSAQYDRIVVEGELLKTCFSLSFTDSSLEEGWPAALETAYKAGASGTSGYSALSEDEQGRANDLYRGADRLASVYAHFRAPTDWDWTNGFDVPCAPIVELGGGVSAGTAQTMWHVDRPLLRWIPLQTGYDYSTATPTNENAEGVEPELRRPFVLVQYNSQYHYVEHLNSASDGAVPNGRVRMLDTNVGLEVAFDPNHILSSGHFSGAEPSRIEAAIDYESIVATVACETDDRLAVTVLVTASQESGADRTLVIRVPNCEAWHLVEGTVVGITAAGGLKRAPAGYLVRDDSARLRAVAVLAKGWYSRERAAVRVSLERFEALPRPGALLLGVSSSVYEQQTNSVVTRVAWDCVAATSTVETGFIELDAVGASGIETPELPDNRAVARVLERRGRELETVRDAVDSLPVRLFP